MAVVNIRRDVDDKFYRYRMPLLMTKIEGKGNGIKTVVPNMSDIARALSRPPTYPTKFFGCELGAQTSFDEKNDRYIVNGAHDATKLRELLDGFIDKFVLCKSCKNPETDLIITKSEEIVRDCKACGERTGVDMRHKLTTFIVKNPPKNPKKSKGKKGNGDAAPTSNGGQHAESASADVDAEADAGAESDDDLMKRIKAEAAVLNKDTSIAKEEWSVDTSPEAVKARTKAVEAAMGSIALDDEGSDEDANSPYGHLGRWIKDNRKGLTATKIYQVATVLKEGKEANAAESAPVAKDDRIRADHKVVQVVGQALFTEDIVKEITSLEALFTEMVDTPEDQKALLGGIERFVGVDHPDLVASVPKILMAFYQADILDEELIQHWGTHASKKYVDKEISKKVRKASKPFLTWLQEAEESEDDDE
ncbi:hypothetical protein EIP91_006973 [Steccherinum ochraceum]|uniref:W2 domain-containing protein n=1 Tax=Steccherinum ochraceum TaxID=92696 RepID=A0A4R0RJ90_9APHY|nr:hypothetical protein EIP91_006973 [Steccherinum ochraceum]